MTDPTLPISRSNDPDAVPTPHHYLSTACLHGHHTYCQGKTRQDGGEKIPARCKWCEARCVCECHREESGDGGR